jgi:hypothetical protein
MGTVITAGRALSIGRASDELGEDLCLEVREARYARVVGGALGLKVGQHAIPVAHPRVGIIAGIARRHGALHFAGHGQQTTRETM